jgi:hypothetical protein
VAWCSAAQLSDYVPSGIFGPVRAYLAAELMN